MLSQKNKKKYLYNKVYKSLQYTYRLYNIVSFLHYYNVTCYNKNKNEMLFSLLFTFVGDYVHITYV